MNSLLLFLGALVLGTTFCLSLLHVEPFASYFYLFAWYSLIFTVDCLIRLKDGRSLILRCGPGFLLILFWSTVSWFFFELLNLRLQNWHYIFITEREDLRLLGFFFAFATVFPGIFWIEHYLAALGVAAGLRGPCVHFPDTVKAALPVCGVVFLILPLVVPQVFYPLVWGGLILLLAPANYRHGEDSLLHQLEEGRCGPLVRLLLAGLIAGLLWEFLNFWALSKWIYTVPLFEELKLFEMPLAGFLGFPPFAVACSVIYRLLVWHRLAPPLSACLHQKPRLGSSLGLAVVLALATLFSACVYAAMQDTTILSLTPRVRSVEGLAPGAVSFLEKRGVRYLTDLEGWASDRFWEEMQAELGQQATADLERKTRLYLHQGIGVECGNALVRVGISSVESLVNTSAPEVRRRLVELDGGACGASRQRIQVWVSRARRVDLRGRKATLVDP